MELIDFFDCVYVVNLPDRKDRRKKIIQELNKVEIPLVPNKTEIFPAIRPSSAQGFPNAAVRGCFLSHLNIIKEAKRRKLANVLIMEDDLVISKDFKIAQNSIVQKLHQTNWGFVYLGHREKLEQTSQVTLQPWSQPIVTAHFYGINSVIFDRLIAFLEELQQRPPGDWGVDSASCDRAYNSCNFTV